MNQVLKGITPFRRLGCAMCALGFAGAAGAQSFNIDLNDPTGGPLTGGGSPSSSFSAAATGQAGFLNSVDAAGPHLATPLLGLDGSSTSATIMATGGIGSYGGYNNHALTGDFRALM